MKRICFIIFIFIISSFASHSQSFSPDWYIVEPGCSIGVVKSGVNDLMLYTAMNKTIDRNAIMQINEGIKYTSGSVILIYAKINDAYLATDVEGRTLLVKGNVTRVETGNQSGTAYVKQTFTQDGITLKQASYVWIKKINAAKTMATIQTAGKKSIEVAVDKLYVINETTAQMIPSIKFFPAE